MTRPTLLLLACLAVLPAAVSAQSRVYTWVDSGGVRHYSQTPPPKGTATERDIKTREGSGATPVAGDPAKPRSQSEQSCAEARVNAQTLASSMAVSSDKDGDGKPEVLSTAERNQAAAAAQAQIDLYCGKG